MLTTKPLHPSLPPKPVFLTLTEQRSQNPPSKSLCAICNSSTPKYTCPGCSTRTCSLPCSASHKSSTGCTGQRNKTAYVPMNKYSWGSMMDDYVFLEDVGRRVSDWGRDIAQGRIADAGSLKGGNRDMKGKGRGKGRGGYSKRDTLKMHLEAKDIDVDLLPLGMDRRKLNHSTWDFKKQTAFLTIEFVFHKPKDPLAPSSRLADPPYRLYTHKNDIRDSLISLIRSKLQGLDAKSKKREAFPAWIKPLVFPNNEDLEAFTNPQCVMAACLDPLVSKRLRLPSRNAYCTLDCTQPLETLLHHMHFVEFPTIEVWEEFEGTVVDIQGVVQQEEQRPPKRRKLNHKAGKKAIQGLLGGYGSSDEEVQEESQKILAALDQYAGSEDEELGSGLKEDNGTGTDDGENDGEIEDADPRVLLELIRNLREREMAWTSEKDDAVDWGDDEVDDEDEGGRESEPE